MKRIRKKFRDMKYRHKLTILLVTSSLVPMTMLALYSHNSMSRLVRHNEVEDTSSILEQTRESIDSQIEVYTGLINYLTYSPDIEEMINEHQFKELKEELKNNMYPVDLAEILREVDEKRSAFQEQCTATRWGDGNEYDLCIDTGKIGIEKAAELILQYIEYRK